MSQLNTATGMSRAEAFRELGLQASLIDAVSARGYSVPTPVQVKAIPLVLQGEDVIGGAQTGTGKTAAFVLPILQRLKEPGGRGCTPRVLILTPTRELAAQVHQSVVDYGSTLKFKSAAIFGGVNIRPQISALRNGIDILVATPGRLIDHLQQKTLNLSRIETLVLDEADRMLDMGFIHDIRRITEYLPKKRQNLLFSATYSDEIRKLASSILTNPVSVEVAARNTAAATVSHVVHPVAKTEKQRLLSKLIKENSWFRILIFTRTKHGADRVAKYLMKDGIPSAAIHGNKSQNARTRALSEFKSGKVQTLVATDIAARGLDINELPHVINYELPNVPEDYVHRIGRTGRAGADGLASSLVSADERGYLKDIEKLLRHPIEVKKISGYEQEAVADDPPHIIQARKAAEMSRQRRGPRPGASSGRRTRPDNARRR